MYVLVLVLNLQFSCAVLCVFYYIDTAVLLCPFVCVGCCSCLSVGVFAIVLSSVHSLCPLCRVRVVMTGSTVVLCYVRRELRCCDEQQRPRGCAEVARLPLLAVGARCACCAVEQCPSPSSASRAGFLSRTVEHKVTREGKTEGR